MTVDAFFEGHPDAQQIYDALAQELMLLGQVSVAPSKSQIAFRRHHTVAVVWRPEQYLKQKMAPLVLTLSFPEPVTSPRWKEVVKISPNHFTHHLELHHPAEVDEEVRSWLRRAWAAA
ncbi:MAG: DUF5655 domain-containing protein [Pseudomonadota bacterium]